MKYNYNESIITVKEQPLSTEQTTTENTHDVQVQRILYKDMMLLHNALDNYLSQFGDDYFFNHLIKQSYLTEFRAKLLNLETDAMMKDYDPEVPFAKFIDVAEAEVVASMMSQMAKFINPSITGVDIVLNYDDVELMNVGEITILLHIEGTDHRVGYKLKAVEPYRTDLYVGHVLLMIIDDIFMFIDKTIDEGTITALKNLSDDFIYSLN